MMWWPAALDGGRIIDEPIVASDIAPTVMAAAGLEQDPSMDGIDLLPSLTGASPWEERDIFWELRGQTAMRRGPWKLVLQRQIAESGDPIEPVWLSNLSDDPGETANLAEAEPERCAQMQACALRWRE